MTICESLKNFINEYDGADFSDIDIDIIENGDKSLSIFKSPNKEVIDYLDGSKLITEYYQFFAKQSAQIEKQRVSNQELLEDFEEWIEEKNMDEEYPDLGSDKVCESIAITNSSSISYMEEKHAIYQMTIAIQYMKER